MKRFDHRAGGGDTPVTVRKDYDDSHQKGRANHPV